MKRILITGASGFVGHYLSQLYLSHGWEVHGLQLDAGTALPEEVQPHAIDLEDLGSLQTLPRNWDAVVHLAAASIPALFASTAPILHNLSMTLNLLEHLDHARVLIISSCHVYAPSLEVRREDAPIVPQGRYGLSKHLVEQLMPHFLPKLDIRVARPFNHLGPGQRPELVIPSLMRRLSHLKPGEELVMKGTNSVRDFIDVRDVVQAYQAILELEAPAQRIFNVSTGRGRSIEELAQEVLHILGRNCVIRFEGVPNSTDDNPHVVGDPGRLEEASGWKARISLGQSLRDMAHEFQLV